MMDRQMNERTDICECRVAFVTEKLTQRHPINSLESDFKTVLGLPTIDNTSLIEAHKVSLNIC